MSGFVVKMVDGVGHLAYPLYLTKEELVELRDRLGPDLAIRPDETSAQWSARTGVTSKLVMEVVDMANQLEEEKTT